MKISYKSCSDLDFGWTILGVDFVQDILIFITRLEFHDPESKIDRQADVPTERR